MLASTVWVHVLKVYQFKPLSWTLSTLAKQSKKLSLTLRILIQYSWKYLRYTEPHQTIHSYTSTQSSSSPPCTRSLPLTKKEPEQISKKLFKWKQVHVRDGTPKKQPNKIRYTILSSFRSRTHNPLYATSNYLQAAIIIVALSLKTNSQHNSPSCTSTCTTDQHTTTFYIQDDHYKLAKHSDL